MVKGGHREITFTPDTRLVLCTVFPPAASPPHLRLQGSMRPEKTRSTSRFPACFAGETQDHIGAGRESSSASPGKFNIVI